MAERKRAMTLIDKCRDCKRGIEIYKFDRYRRNYDNLNFQDKKKLAFRWLKKYPEQAYFDYGPVSLCLRKIIEKPAKIIEIGGWRGDLAMKVLREFENIEIWHNYDLLDNNGSQKCRDERYKLISIDDYIWNKHLTFQYNALIATHMIEHIKWIELVHLIQWIPSGIKTVLFEAPLPDSAENMSWKGDHSSHVLEKGWAQVTAEMKRKGFNVAYQDRNTFIFCN
jgi:hypothetical protein